MHRELREDFPVETDVLFLKSINECRIRRPLCAECRIHAHDPERAEFALLPAAIDVGVLSRLDNRFIRFHERLAPHAAVPLRKGADLLVSSVPNYSALNSHNQDGMACPS